MTNLANIQFSEEVFLESLRELASLDDETKRAAKEKIRALEIQASDMFGISLVNYVVDSENPIASRKEASATLKHYIEAHWCSGSEGFQPPLITLESKRKIKESLPSGLYSSSSEVIEGVVYSISAITRLDGPENWPELLDTLVMYLNSEEYKYIIDGVMEVFTAFAKQLTDTQLPHIGPVILREVYNIFKNKERYSDYDRCSAVEIFAKMVTTVSAFKQPALIEQYLGPSITKFCAQFVQNDLVSNTDLGCEILKAIQTLTKTLPKCISDFLPKLLPSIWKTLIECAKDYRESSDDEDSEGEGSEGGNGLNEDTGLDEQESAGENGLHEDTGLDEEEPESENDFVVAAFEFIHTLMSGPNGYTLDFPEYNLSDYYWFHLQDSLPPEVLHHLIIFIEITDKQIEQWVENPSQFVTEEKLIHNTSNPHNIRSKAQEVLMKIVQRPERAAANALCDVTLKQIEAGNAMRNNDNSDVNRNWWKLHEASIQLFGLMKEVVAEKQQAETLSFDVAAFLENVVLVNLNNSESHPLLIGRCLYIGGLYADQMPLEMRSRFLESTINCLKNQLACTRILAAKAANYWLCAASMNRKNCDNGNVLRPHLPALFQELFNLGNQFMSAEVLTIVLENFATLASLDKAFTASVESKICTLAIAAFVNFRSDCLILGICQKIFKELTLNPKCVETLQTYLVPTLVGKLIVCRSEDPKDEEVQVDALEVLMVLVKDSPQPLSNFLIESAFPATCRFILSSDKYCTLLKGGKVIRMYLSVAADQVTGYKDSDGNTGLRCITRVATHLLNFKPSGLLVEDACEILTSLIRKAGNRLGENVDPLLIAVFGCMQGLQARSHLRRLLLVFAHLVNADFEAVFKFLSTAQGPNEQCAFTFVISNGFCKEHESFDRDDRRTVTLALSKILEHSVMHQDSKLHQINFRAAEGDSETAIPLLVEISKLISNELFSDAYRSL